MLMTRILYFALSGMIILLNASAYLHATVSKAGLNETVFAALVVNSIIFPIALVIAYRIGQFTGVEKLKKAAG